jgi:hypothetical protein
MLYQRFGSARPGDRYRPEELQAILPQRPAVRGSEKLETCEAELTIELEDSQTPEVHAGEPTVHARVVWTADGSARAEPGRWDTRGLFVSRSHHLGICSHAATTGLRYSLAHNL